jgi:hypothetical protein
MSLEELYFESSLQKEIRGKSFLVKVMQEDSHIVSFLTGISKVDLEVIDGE